MPEPVKEAPRLELVKDVIEFLSELVGVEVLSPARNEEETDPELQIDGVPFEVSSDRADQLIADLKMWLDRERRGIHEDHPLVKCQYCGEEATHCEFGNSWCPSCGETLDGAPEIKDTRDILDVIADEEKLP